MSTASIIHVGPDDCHRIAVFKTAGYLVDICTSFAQLHQALIRIPPAQAVAVAESSEELARKTVSLARAITLIPLILFQCVDPCLDETDFDLVVPALTDPNTWVTEIQQLIEESRALCLRSQTIRHQSALPAQESALRRENAAAAVIRSRLVRQRSKMEVENYRKG
jgi:hypothetical protein